jgi:hypothetical protein
MAADIHPGDAEAAGAVAGMRDLYGPAAVGQWVTGVTSGRRWSGEVLEVRDETVIVALDGATLQVPLADIDN